MNPSHNRKFFRWSITDKIVKIDHHDYYVCICECGRTKNISKTSIKNRTNKLCDCMISEIKDEMMDKSVLSLAKLYNTTEYSMKCFIRSNPELLERYNSRERKSYVKIKVEGIKARKYTQVEKLYRCIFPVDFRMNHKGLKTLAGAVIRQAVRDCDEYFFKSDNYENFAVCAGFNLDKEKYLKEIEKRKLGGNYEINEH